MKLTKLPLPPSVNGLYTSVKGRLIKSAEGRIYDKKIEMYKLRHFKQLEEIHNELKGKCIKVDRYFVLHKSRVFNKKDGDIKKRDYLNYLKALDDGLAKLINIDDRYFKSGLCELMWCENERDEQVIVFFEKFMIKEYRGIL